MESQQVMENFESLWFFANVFSNRTPPPAGEKLRNPIQNDAVEAKVEKMATPIFQNQQNEDEITIEDCNGLGSEMKTEEKRKSRIRRRRSNCWRQRGKNVGEMDVSYAVKEICECWLFEERIGNGNCYQMKKMKMPLFEDNMAMKEHIRSWAYAVACAVR